MKIKTQSIYGAEPLMCALNVRKRIKACGGSAVYGWIVRPDSFCTMYVSHVVWRDDNGELWDVTPVFTGVNQLTAIYEMADETDFVQDDAAAFQDKSLPTRYVAHPDSNNHVIKACEYMEIADAHLKKADIAKCRYWTERANTEMRRGGTNGFWDSPASDMMADVLQTMMPVKD